MYPKMYKHFEETDWRIQLAEYHLVKGKRKTTGTKNEFGSKPSKVRYPNIYNPGNQSYDQFKFLTNL